MSIEIEKRITGVLFSHKKERTYLLSGANESTHCLTSSTYAPEKAKNNISVFVKEIFENKEKRESVI